MTCTYCEAEEQNPADNLHCVADGTPHAWHTCGDLLSERRGADCPNSPTY